MALINCPECKREISSTVNNCPHCGYLLTVKETIKKKKSSNVIVVLVGIIILLLLFAQVRERVDTPVDKTPDKITAYAMSRQFVEENLKAPSSAKFASYSDSKTHVTLIDTNKFKVNSWVDSENSFGAMMRTNYSCIVYYIGNDKWRLEGLQFDE